MHYLIIGFGVTGQAIFKYLINSIENDEHKLAITIYDQKPIDLSNLVSGNQYNISNISNISNIEQLAENNKYQNIDLAIASPGIDPKEYRDLLTNKYNIKIISDIQLFANQYLFTPARHCEERVAQQSNLVYSKITSLAGHVRNDDKKYNNLSNRNNNQIYCVTGTNGKSTVCALLHFLLGEQSNIGGNYGRPAIDLLTEEITKPETVLELSSYQLELTDYLPSLAATCLNISPDHLDWHKGYHNYINSKLKIYNNSDFNILDLNNKDILELYKTKILPSKLNNNNKPNLVFYSNLDNTGISEELENQNINILGLVSVVNNQNNIFIQYNNQDVINIINLPDVLKAKHNLNNLLAVLAMLVAKYYNTQSLDNNKQGIKVNIKVAEYLKVYLQNIKQFKGLPHRCELVSSFNNIRVYNDSKATNLDATITAINSIVNLDNKIILILGGIAKDDIDRIENRQKFIDCLNNYNNKITDIIIFTKDDSSKDKFINLISEASKAINYRLADDLEALKEIANHLAKPGDSILFSPAGSSFDQFKNYIERGELFTACLK